MDVVRRLLSAPTGMTLAGLRRKVAASVQALGLSNEINDFLLMALERQESKTGLVQTLHALADFLSRYQEKPSTTIDSPRVSRVAVEGIDGGGSHDLISIDNVLYAFGGGAVSRGVIRAPWGAPGGVSARPRLFADGWRPVPHTSHV